MVRDQVAYPFDSGVPLSHYLFLLDLMEDHVFSLCAQESSTTLNLVLVVHDLPEPITT